ncbi:hypothetical protein GCM10027048_14860 [Hymenobacter coalescens]
MVLLLAWLWAGHSQAQNYQVPTSGTASVATCAGTIYDDGGAAGNYAANADGMTVLRPATTGNRVRLVFTAFDTESYYDRLTIYDGVDASAPILGVYDGVSGPGTVLATNSSGALTLRFVSDGIGNYAGFAATISCVPMAPLPDLALQGASANPQSVAAGNAVSTNVTILNSSVSPVNSSDIGYYLSTNNTLDASDVLLNSLGGGPLGGGGGSTRFSNVTIPGGTANGNYFLLFVADYQALVNEANEQNNVAAVPLTVVPPGADLVIQFPSVNPGTTTAGGLINLSSQITNQGTTLASSSNIGYYLSTNTTLDASDVLLTTTLGGQLMPPFGQSRYATATVPAGTAVGTYYVLFVADYQNQVAEVNEQNNVASQLLTVTSPSVDLVVQTSSAPTTTTAGASLSANAYVLNQGNTIAANSSLGVYFSTNSTLDAADQLLFVSPGGSMSPGFSQYRSGVGTVPTGLAPGTYYLLFVADPQNLVVETNETNNVQTRTIAVVTPAVDLTVSQLYVSPSTTTAGGTVSVQAYVYNQGNAAATPSQLGYYLSANTTLDANDVLVGQTNIGSLTAGNYWLASGQAVIPTGTAPGAYYMLFAADHANQISESNEQNNVGWYYVTVVTPTVDLTISQPYVTPSTTVAGGTVSAQAYVYNQGNAPAGASQLGYYLSRNTTLDASDVPVGQASVQALNGSGYWMTNAQVTIPTGTAPGAYYMLFAADNQNAVSESNEQNNVGWYYVTVVTPSVDLAISQPGLSTNTSAAGNTLNVYAYVLNQGNTPSPASSLGYFLSTNTTLDAGDVALGQLSVPGISANYYHYATSTVQIPAGTPAGAYFVLFVADGNNQVSETNESNNVAWQPLQLVAPGIDLVVQQWGLARTSVPAGGALSGGTYIVNLGTTTAASSPVGFYLSTNATLDAADVLLTNATGGSLGAGQSSLRSTTFTVPVGTTPGAYFVLFVADPQNAVAETNENNNVGNSPLTVTGPFNGTVVPFNSTASLTSCGTTVYDHGGTSDYADYANGSLTITPGTAGARVRITLTAFSTESGYDYLRIYDGPSTSSPLLGSYTGYAATGTSHTATNAAGVLTIQFTSDGSVVSSGFEATVSCVGGGGGTGAADLLVQQPSASPLTVSAGSPMGVGATIRNQGTADAANSNVGYFLSTNTTLDAGDVQIGTSSGGMLAAGASATRTGSFAVPAATPAGVYRLLVVADPQNAVAESDEQNNVLVYASSITVTAAGTDLAVSNLTVLPSPAVAGGSIAVTCFHENAGTASAAAHSVGVYLSADNVFSANDVVLATSSAAAMAPSFGMTRVLTGVQIPLGTTPGNYFVLFVADPQNAVTEANEQNNVASRALRVDPALAVREQAGGYAVNLLPNPTATGAFEVRFDGMGVTAPVELTLLNSLGQEVRRQSLSLRGASARAVFSTQQLSHGVYTLRITGKNLNVTRRVVVE